METSPGIFPKESKKAENLSGQFVFPSQKEMEEAYANAKAASLGKRGMLSELFSKQLGEHMEFRIDRITSSELGDEYFFKLADQKDKKTIAELRFRVQKDKSGHAFYNLHHRLVESQEFGIPGSLFLEKAEEYLAFVGTHPDTIHEIRIGSNQPKVSEWLPKNNYSFLSEKDEIIFENIQENPQEYRTVRVFIDGERKDPVFLRKEVFSDKDLLQFLDTSGGDEVFRVSSKDVARFKDYLPNVFFKKDI